MDDQEQAAGDPSQNATPTPGGFTFASGLEQRRRGGASPKVWAAAALIAIIVACVAIGASRKNAVDVPRTLQPADPYSPSLPLSQFAMSESGNLSGGKMTYLDGRVQNTGAKTVTAATVQVVFGNDESMPPELVAVPLTLIGMKQPYIDVQPISAHPLKPGDDRDFRLTFETVPENWNRQMPMVHVVRVESR